MSNIFLLFQIIVMSATMDVDHFSKYFNSAPVLYVEGRQYPVQVQKSFTCFLFLSQIQYTIALICFYIVSVYSSSMPLWTASSLLSFSLFSCARFAQPQTFRYSIYLGWAGGPWGRDPFNTSDLWAGTLFLSVSGIHLHSLLLSRNEKPKLFCIRVYPFLSSHPFHVKFCFIQMSVLFPQVYHSAQSQSDYLFASLVTLFQIHNKEDAK